MAINDFLLSNLLLPSIRASEIVECVRKYVDGISQNLQSLTPYEPGPLTLFLFLRIMLKQVKSSSWSSQISESNQQVDVSESINFNQSIITNRFYPIEVLIFIRKLFVFPESSQFIIFNSCKKTVIQISKNPNIFLTSWSY